MRRRLAFLLRGGVRWTWPRTTTTVAVLVLSLVSALVAWRLLPASVRPAPAWTLAAGLSAYAVLRLDAYAQLGKRVKHAWVDRLGGDVDDAQTWALAVGAAAVVLVVVALLGRL